MYCVLAAKSTILVHFKTIGRVFLVFHGVVVSLFTFVASKSDFYSHCGASKLASLLYIDSESHL